MLVLCDIESTCTDLVMPGMVIRVHLVVELCNADFKLLTKQI